ncbi:MAG: NAD(P)-dependent oxidoreductase [Candidatus Methylumidiphilus alinenensis]|uniref:NAD(P)-dependent oxidoreductase n=1 Tax=Candidatus Methylumidiphilus alinenensis TaxID=2202197 RepID=A0A2W4QUJ3_9GAMM|nr:MAG: NAD(P)-dependent oxidoreductase [Candidatus Methylumidiphilus alinenensis]
MPNTILITGATGNISSGIIAQLNGSGHSLRALVRNPEKAEELRRQGVEISVGDLEKPWTLGSAFAGVDTVWILAPPGPRAPEQCSNALWAAKQGGARHVVRMSAFGAAHTAPTINSRLHALSDAELVGSGIPFTILKPHFFMQNLMMGAQSVAQQGAMYFALADGKMGLIDSRDISDFAAHVLTTTGHEGKTYILTGSASLSMHQIAAAIGNAIGKPVAYVPVSVDDARQSMAQMGLDDWTVNLMCDYYAAYSANWGDLVTDDFQRVTGKAPRSIEQFAKDFGGAFGNQ